MHVVWNGYGFREIVTWLSRITHCRGFGVQSPSAYRFIRYVVNEHYPYYAYADLREEFPNIGSTDEKLCRLYFRIANYQQPMTFINIGRSDAALVAYVNAGCRKTRVIDYSDTYEVERTVADETIKGDGTSIVKLYFMLNAITFHLTYGEGVTNVQVYSTFGSVAQSEVVDNVYTYTVSYTDTIYFEVELEVGYDFDGIGLLVDGEYEIQDNSANPEYRMVIPAEEFNIKATASRRLVYVYYFTDTSSSSYADFSMHQYGATVTLKPNTFTKDGATFMGWATTTDKANQGVVDYEDGATFTITGNVNLYAVWAESGGSNWWIWIIIAFAIILVIVIIIIIIVVVKKKKEKDKIRAK